MTQKSKITTKHSKALKERTTAKESDKIKITNKYKDHFFL